MSARRPVVIDGALLGEIAALVLLLGFVAFHIARGMQRAGVL